MYPLEEALRSTRVNRPNRLVILTSRVTFSAASMLAANIRLRTRAVFIGEPTGGNANFYAQMQPVELPVTGLTVALPTRWHEQMPGRPGLAIEPDVRVDFTARDFFDGRDPVLAVASNLGR
jgi:C-terminal processing protease CtpA/Prc